MSPANIFILEMKIVAQALVASHRLAPFSMNILSKMSACRSKIQDFYRKLQRDTHGDCTSPVSQKETEKKGKQPKGDTANKTKHIPQTAKCKRRFKKHIETVFVITHPGYIFRASRQRTGWLKFCAPLIVMGGLYLKLWARRDGMRRRLSWKKHRGGRERERVRERGGEREQSYL